MISGMSIRRVLWNQPRDVFLYSCEAYRQWMVASQRSSLAETYAEMPLASYVGFVSFALLSAAYPDAGHRGPIDVLVVVFVAACATHIYVKKRWGLAAQVYARYRPIPYVRDVVVSGSMVVLFVFMLALTRDSPILTLCAVAAHWLIVGTVFYAFMERRRLSEQEGTPSLP